MAQRRKIGEESARGSVDPKVLRIQDSSKIRLLDLDIIEWRQHGVNHVDDAEDQFETIVCPGPGLCPLCRKPVDMQGNQRFPIQRRLAVNVWDYSKNEIKLLIAGPQVFNEFDNVKKVGIDPLASDWIINKAGSGKQTKYTMVRGDAEPFAFADQVTPDQLIDLDNYGNPPSTDRIFEALDKLGWDYDSLEIPTYTLEQALKFVIPFGKKMKGLTVEQALTQDQDWCEWLHGKKVEAGEYGDPVFVALHTAMLDRGLVAEIDDIPEASSAPATPPSATDAGQVDASVQAEESADMVATAATDGMVDMEAPDGSIQTVPESAAAALQTAGYKIVENSAPEPEEAAPETVAEPTPIPADRAVHVKVNGTSIPLTFKAALDLAKSGQDVEFGDEEAGFATFLISTGGEPPSAAEVAEQANVQSPEEAAMHEEAQEPQADTQPASADDPEKPFKCDQCEWRGKTKGSLTQHAKREHGSAPPSNGNGGDPAPAAAAPATKGDDHDAVLAEVKAKLAANQPNDYQVILKLFDDVAGKRNITDFSTDELRKLSERLDAEAANA